MAQSDKEILQAFGKAVISDIKSDAVSQGRTASHKAEQLLRSDATETTLNIVDGAGYTQWGWEDGRGPGKRPPIANIMQWIIDKRLQVAENKRKGLAFAIARSIGNRGTLLFRIGGKSGVLSNNITVSRVTALSETFGSKYATIAKSEVLKAFKS